MSATVTVRISPDAAGLDDAVEIPASAVFGGDDGGSYVWKVDSATMTVNPAPIEAGQMSGSSITILEGLTAGDRIAASGVQQLDEGMKVRELTD